MKLFTQIALVSAMSISANAMAMQAMNDADLSATTGQDGISIGLDISKLEIAKLHVFDGDGLATTGDNPAEITLGNAGAITVNNVVLTKNAATLSNNNFANIKIDTDGGEGSPFLNIGAAIAGLDISLGKIEVNDVASGDASTPYVAGKNSATILNGLSLSTGSTSANIQLGNTPQGAMIKLAGEMTGGLTISNLSLHDASSGGGGDLVIGSIKLNNTKNGNLSTNADIAVTSSGLAVTAVKDSTDIYIKSIRLGSEKSASIGDVAVSGLKLYNGAGFDAGAKITISGH